ncbi:MAG: DUF4255 domain-containing protein [Candidatus Bathyarchaeota archaeon]|nr:DUF4255 domain-containing protein [Candidatus Termiticorpusculum sp.]
MSDYRAIATVTAVIRDILVESQENIGSNAAVKTSSPSDLKEPSNDSDVLNLFLYQVTSNNVCNSLDLPTRNQNGKLLTKPKLALDLHYLLTTASKNELKAQLMLSSAMMALHENAIIPKNKIEITLSSSEYNDETFLAGSNLSSQIESLKINLHSMTTEELTKLWSSFFQTGYRLSVAYHVSVILLESNLEFTPSIPVSKRQLHVISLKQPIIEKIEPQIMTYDPTKKIVIKGHNLYSDKVVVRLNDNEIINIDNSELSEHQLRFSITEDTLAGVKQVQVLQNFLFNPNDTKEHLAHTSNIAAFVLTPNLKPLTKTQLQHGEELKLDFEPGIAPHQKAHVLIGNYTLNVNLPPTNLTTYPLKSLTVKIPNTILAGTYPVRLRINNADSPLKNNNNNDDDNIITITNNS